MFLLSSTPSWAWDSTIIKLDTLKKEYDMSLQGGVEYVPKQAGLKEIVGSVH